MAIDALRPPLRGTTHMAVAGHYLAALAAYEILEAGGTAADAGVAAGLCMGVVQSDLVNIAGVAPILICEPGGKVISIAGLGTWPAAADDQEFSGVVEVNKPTEAGLEVGDIEALLARNFDLRSDDVKLINWSRLQ